MKVRISSKSTEAFINYIMHKNLQAVLTIVSYYVSYYYHISKIDLKFNIFSKKIIVTQTGPDGRYKVQNRC